MEQPPQQPPSSDPPPSQPPPQQQIINSNPNNSLTSYPQNPNSNPNRPINLTSYTPQNPNSNPNSYPVTRSWSQSQPTSQFSHFPSSNTNSSSSSLQIRPGGGGGGGGGGFAIGVPAGASQASSMVTPAFSSSFGAHYGGGVGIRTSGDSSFVSSSSNPSQPRPTMQGISGMGIIGSQIRPGGVPPSALHPQRPVQTTSAIRPQVASSNLSSIPQNFQGHGILRPSSITTPTTSTPTTSQTHQPWLATSHIRPPLPSQTPRPQINPQSLQQRSHTPQQPPPQQPPQLLPSQQHFPTSNPSQDNFGQQRVSSQPSTNSQQPIASFSRVPGPTNPRPTIPGMAQPSTTTHFDGVDGLNGSEKDEPCNTILSKRNIRELVNQIDPSEKLNPEVEDVLVDIAEDFIDSVTTFGCSLAKHRKSNTLEAKDILLHLERTWNMTLPGFSGDEIKTFKKPVSNDIHKERVSLIKKSLAGAEIGNTKPSVGPATGNMKGHLAKATNIVGS